MNRSSSSTSSTLPALLRAILSIACSVAIITAIVYAEDADQAGSVLSAQHDQQIDRHSADGPTPTPLPCPRCWFTYSAYEDFDTVKPPALPTDWLATNAQGPPPLWVTSNSGVPMPPADTVPNSLFVDDPPVISDKRVDGRLIGFFESCCVRLTFRHNFNLEASDQDPNVGYDGGVLELSTDGGNTFQDITAAGGSFVTGGYNRTITTGRGSPIAGRQAWSGDSGGYITTVVNVPNFQTTGRLRWRMGSDTSGGNEGWRVDTVGITWCNGMGTPCPTPTATPTPSPRPTTIPRIRPTPLPHP